VSIFARFAILVAWCGARSGCPFSVFAGDRIRVRQAAIADPVLEAVARSRFFDRVVAGLCVLSAAPIHPLRDRFKPSTLLRLHRALIQRKSRQLFS
jgi:hypothetical protein